MSAAIADKLQTQLPLPVLTEIGLGGGSVASTHDEIHVITDLALRSEVGTVVAFSQRSGGCSQAPFESLNLGRKVNDDLRCVDRNRSILLHALGLGKFKASAINPVQVHGSAIHAIVKPEAKACDFNAGLSVEIEFGEVPVEPRLDIECDAVLSTLPSVPAVLCFADCVPIIIVAPGGSFVVVHSGWKGTYARISQKAALALSAITGCPTSSMNAYIGPHIGDCCYEVSSELLQKFIAEFGNRCDAGDGHLDLECAVKRTLLDAGLRDERLASCSICTSCSTDKFFSYRAENGNTGRFAAVGCKLYD